LESGKIKGLSTEAAATGESQKLKVKSQNGEKKKPTYNEKREFDTLEKEIANLEAEKQQVEQQLSNPEAPFEQLSLLSKRIGDITNELTFKEMRWLELSEMM
jgi:ATP-binding cassette subfamily F protein uup